nr:transporter substrate-binding domain-containing protein [Neobacillus sp. Marseille-Q6967]
MKKGFFKTVTGLVLTGALAISLAGCGKTETTQAKEGLEGLQDKGKIVVGMMAATPPYEFHSVENGKDEIIGSDIKLLEEVSKDLGVEYEIKDMDFDGLLVALQAGKIDMIISAISPTEEREKNADFSNVYYKDRHVMLVHKDNLDKYTSNESLAKAKIAAINSSVQAQIVQKEFPNAELKLLGKSTELALDLAANKVDAVLVDRPTATLLAKGNPKIAITELLYDDDTAGAAIAMPNGTDKELMDTINKTIERTKPEYEKWLTEAMEKVK